MAEQSLCLESEQCSIEHFERHFSVSTLAVACCSGGVDSCEHPTTAPSVAVGVVGVLGEEAVDTMLVVLVVEMSVAAAVDVWVVEAIVVLLEVAALVVAAVVRGPVTWTLSEEVATEMKRNAHIVFFLNTS